MTESLWPQPEFQQTVKILVFFIALLGVLIFPFRKKNTHMAAAWASLQSWLFFAPILIGILGAGGNWPNYLVTAIAIFCAKEFFQMTGMYHRGIFVWLTYLCIVVMGYSIHISSYVLFNTIPMMFLALFCLVPIFLNSYKNMLQYISLSIICCLFMGWGLLHMSWILTWSEGTYTLIYMILLSEFCDNVSLAVSRLFGKIKLADQITPRRTVEGFVISAVLTLLVAWGLRHLLVSQELIYWVILGLIAVFVGTIGDLILSVIRRDLGVKDVGIFILGRGGFLDRIDRLIFVAPASYYALLYLKSLG